MKKTYTLPKWIKPIKYEIFIKFDDITFNSFKGKCNISYEKDNRFDKTHITLHNSDLVINKVYITDLIEKKIIHTNKIRYYKPYEQVDIYFDKIPTKGTLFIEYDGIIRNDPIGLYKCFRQNSIIDTNSMYILTQFEPISARKMFPCFDEPAFKAIFKIRISLPSEHIKENIAVLSNMPVKKTETDNFFTNTFFKSTPLMSTYLVAIYIGEGYRYQKISKKGINIGVYVPDKIKSANLALDVAVKALDYMTDFFGIEYPLAKLDMVSTPNFAAGAMENWGLIIYREKLLFVDTLSPETELDVIYTICHELAHQWFGNLVTIKWWSDLWLNESFATWLGWECTGVLNSKINIDEIYFERNYIKSLRDDSLNSSHPICLEVSSVSSAELILQIFDSITYQKGAAIIKMIINYVGLDIFKKCIQRYIRIYSYKNTTTDDLWNCIDDISGKNISSMMISWLYQKNYPMISLEQYDNKHTLIEQEIYNFNIIHNIPTKNIWIIPLSKDLVLSNKKIIVLDDYVQKNYTDPFGFYRINYCDELLHNILGQKISIITLASLIDDYYSFYKKRVYTFDQYIQKLNLILDHNHNVSKLILRILLGNFEDFKMIFPYESDSVLISYKNILKRYLSNFDTDLMEPETKKIYLDLGYGIEYDYANNFFSSLWNKVIQGNMENHDMIFFDTALICGVEKHNGYNFVKDIMISKTDLNTKCIEALSMTRSDAQFKDFLEMVKGDIISKQYKQVVFDSAGSNPHLNKYLWEFIKTNWEEINNIFGEAQFGIEKVVLSMKYMVPDKKIIAEISDFLRSKHNPRLDIPIQTLSEWHHISYEIKHNQK